MPLYLEASRIRATKDCRSRLPYLLALTISLSKGELRDYRKLLKEIEANLPDIDDQGFQPKSVASKLPISVVPNANGGQQSSSLSPIGSRSSRASLEKRLLKATKSTAQNVLVRNAYTPILTGAPSGRSMREVQPSNIDKSEGIGGEEIFRITKPVAADFLSALSSCKPLSLQSQAANDELLIKKIKGQTLAPLMLIWQRDILDKVKEKIDYRAVAAADEVKDEAKRKTRPSSITDILLSKGYRSDQELIDLLAEHPQVLNTPEIIELAAEKRFTPPKDVNELHSFINQLMNSCVPQCRQYVMELVAATFGVSIVFDCSSDAWKGMMVDVNPQYPCDTNLLIFGDRGNPAIFLGCHKNEKYQPYVPSEIALETVADVMLWEHRPEVCSVNEWQKGASLCFAVKKLAM